MCAKQRTRSVGIPLIDARTWFELDFTLFSHSAPAVDHSDGAFLFLLNVSLEKLPVADFFKLAVNHMNHRSIRRIVDRVLALVIFSTKVRGPT